MGYTYLDEFGYPQPICLLGETRALRGASRYYVTCVHSWVTPFHWVCDPCSARHRFEIQWREPGAFDTRPLIQGKQWYQVILHCDDAEAIQIKLEAAATLAELRNKVDAAIAEYNHHAPHEERMGSRYL